MHPSPRAETLRPLFPRSLRGSGVWVDMDVALIACSVRLDWARGSTTQLSPHRCLRSIVTAEYRFVDKMQRVSAPQAISAVYTEAAGFCSTEILIAAGNPGGRLKPRCELARALGDSATLAQNVA